MAQAFVADGADVYESIAEALTAWLLAPGEVSVEFATEVAADLGALTAGLHAALAPADASPDMAPREATRPNGVDGRRDAAAHLERALAVAPDECGRQPPRPRAAHRRGAAPSSRRCQGRRSSSGPTATTTSARS